MRLIDADAVTENRELAKKIESFYLTPYIKVDDLLDFIDGLPTIEAVPVVHGAWKLKQGDEGVHWYCSKCREEALFDIFQYQEKSNFCPNCGAKMKGGAE